MPSPRSQPDEAGVARHSLSGSVLTQAALVRVAGAAVLLVLLWLAVAWAVSVP